MSTFELLIDQIYEAGVLPQKWQSILHQLAEISGGEGTLLFATSPGPPRWIASHAIESRILDWTRSKWFLNNPRGQRLVPIMEPRFLTDLDALTEAEMDESDYYTEFLRPRGLGWCVGTTIRSPAGDALVFSVEKAYDKGPVTHDVAERLNGLRPHLARAALLSARLGLERVQSAVATLELVGLPAVALTADGRVVSANHRFQKLAPRIDVGARNKLFFANHASQSILETTIGTKGVVSLGNSIPVRGTSDAPPFVAHVIPLRLGGLDVFSGAAWILYVTALVLKSSPAPELLQALFDLTPAESRVATLVIEGKTIEVIASITQNSENTIRSHLKSVFLKTGVQRQAELVSLLGLGSFG